MTNLAPLVLTASALENPPLAEVARMAVDAGFDGLSLWPGAGYGSDPDHRKIVDDAGLLVADGDALVVWVGNDDPGGPYFEEAPAEQVWAAAETLGVLAVNVLMIGPRDRSGAGTIGQGNNRAAVERCAEVVRRAADRAASFGANVTIEFARSTAVATLHQANAVIEAADAPNAGILLDTWHHHFSGVTNAPLHRVRAIQLSDAPHVRPENFPHATRHRREVPGTGAVDFATVVNGAPDGTPLIVEVFNRPLLRQHGPQGFANLLGASARQIRDDS